MTTNTTFLFANPEDQAAFGIASGELKVPFTDVTSVDR